MINLASFILHGTEIVLPSCHVSKTRPTGFHPVGFHPANDGFSSFRCQEKYTSPPRSMHVAAPPPPHLISRALRARLLHRSSKTQPGGKILLEEKRLSSRASNYNGVSRYIEIAQVINQNRLGIWNEFVLINHKLQIGDRLFRDISSKSRMYIKQARSLWTLVT